MIYQNSVVTINKGEAKIDTPIFLYRGDKEVEINFTILNSPFKYRTGSATNLIESTEADYAQLIIKVPNDRTPVFSEITETKNGKIVFKITADMIDEIEEVGKYDFQIRLFDSEQVSRATIPPVTGGIEIREPIAIEDEIVSTSNEVNVATANYAVTTTATPLDVFDEDGNYIETTWTDKMLITDARLNKIEDGITGVNQKADSIATMIPTKTSDLTNDSDFVTTTEMTDAINNASLGGGEVDLTGYAKITDIPTRTSQLTNDSNYATETYVDNAIENIEITGGSTPTSASNITITDTANNFTATNVEGALQEVGSQIKDIANLKDNIKLIGEKISNKQYTNIKLIGDSITDGYGGTNYNGSQTYSPSTNTKGYCWANSFKDFLYDRYSINVVNKGMYGTMADRLYNNISNVVSNSDDLVIYLTGTNDRPSSDLTSYKNSVKNIIAYVKNIGADIIVMSGIPATETNENQYAHTMQDMDDVIKMICSETNTPFISMYQEYINYCNLHSIDITTTFYDHCHPNNLGYYIIFILLCQKLYLPLNPYKNYKYSSETTSNAVTNINIDSTKTVKLNQTISLIATITPTDATNKGITWSTNNDNVILTPNGLSCTVEGMKVGTSVVTATANDTTNGTISSSCTVTISEDSTITDYTLLCGNLDYTGEGNGAIVNTSNEIVPMIVKRDFDTSNYTTICSNKTIRRISIKIHTAGKLTIGKADLTQYNKNTDISIINPIEYTVTTGVNVLDVNVSCGGNESLTIGAVGDTALPYYAYNGMTPEQLKGFSINTNKEFKKGINLNDCLTLLGAIYI